MSYKTQESIFANAPKISKKDIEKINGIFNAYLFYVDNKKNRTRECECTACGESFTVPFLKRTMTPIDVRFINKGHNDVTRCPKCGAVVTLKQKGKARLCSNLEEWERAVVLKPKGKTMLYAFALYARKRYSPENYRPKPETFCEAVYFTDGKASRMFRHQGYSPDYYETNSIQEPFKTSFYTNCSFEKFGYKLLNVGEISKTNFKYRCGNETIKMYEDAFTKNYKAAYFPKYANYMKFIFTAAYKPQFEKLLKIGLSDFVISFLDKKPMKRYIDWEAETPKEMFKMNKAEFSEFRKWYYGPDDFKAYQKMRKTKHPITYAEAASLSKEFSLGAEEIATMAREYDLSCKKIANYLRKQMEKRRNAVVKDSAYRYVDWLKDYLDFAKKLKYDLSRGDVLLPKDLVAAHDTVAGTFDALMREKRLKEAEKKREAYISGRYVQLCKKFCFENEKYQIIVPTGVMDIVEEGKVLSHCVGGYAERHVNGATTILFMRETKNPEKRLVTIEWLDGRVKQKYQAHDKECTDEQKAFIAEWEKWVQAGSRKIKKAKKGSAA